MPIRTGRLEPKPKTLFHPMNLVAVFVENKPGQTARVTKILADAGVNICWVTIASNGTFGVMKFLVDQGDLAVERLRANGLMVSLTEALTVEVDNQPGALQAIADLLARHGLNLDNCSGFVANNRAVVLIELGDLGRARGLLERHSFRLLTQEQLMGLMATQKLAQNH